MRVEEGGLLVERFDQTLPMEPVGGQVYETPGGGPAWRLSFGGTAARPDPAAAVRALAVELSDDGEAVTDAPWAMVIAYEVPEDELDDLDAWYEQEHTGLLLRCPDWLRTRRYAVTECEGAGWNRLVLHDLSSAEILTAPEVRHSMGTTWRCRLAERPWFMTGGRDPVRRT